jgi:hypothetical protein
MSERDTGRFEIDDEFLVEQEDSGVYENLLDRVDKRRDKNKKGKAAWSKLEEVLAERRLKKDLQDFEDMDA